jgi:hypothetical protein
MVNKDFADPTFLSHSHLGKKDSWCLKAEVFHWPSVKTRICHSQILLEVAIDKPNEVQE